MGVLVYFMEEKHATGKNTGKLKYLYISAVTETQ